MIKRSKKNKIDLFVNTIYAIALVLKIDNESNYFLDKITLDTAFFYSLNLDYFFFLLTFKANIYMYTTIVCKYLC